MTPSDKIVEHLLAHVRDRRAESWSPASIGSGANAGGPAKTARKWRFFRLFPVVIFAVTALLTLKIEAIWQQTQGDAITVAAVEAAAPKSILPAKSDASPPQAVRTPAQKPVQKPVNPAGRLARLTPAAGDSESEGSKKLAESENAESSEKQPLTVYQRKKNRRYTEAEIKILENLRERRSVLENREQEINLRENLLAASEQRIEEKIAELKLLEEKIQSLLRQHDEEMETKLLSLVKVYQSMKPKQAARIFEQLDLKILMDVAERMKEAKFAQILAKMNPERAKELTVELAKKRELPKTGG